jgi:serine/threonine protein kinase
VRLIAVNNGPVPDPQSRLIAGRYRLRRLLGQGSMGTVWEAYDEFLHRPVAVKEVLLPPGIADADADELRERTLREARAIAVVSHPNVITLHDVARENGEPFVVMEYVPAQSLAAVLRSFGPLEVAQAAAVGYAVASGLAAAHQAGVTHRDVKPGNVLVAEDGLVKLTDFGIARNVSEHRLTKTGIMLGSPAYIAPEIATGRPVTPSADLWGLGVTLFAAVEGQAPYDPDGPALEIVTQVVMGEIPRPQSAGPLTEVIAALMVKDPAGRASLTDVRRMLRPLLPPPGTALYQPNATPRSAPGRGETGTDEEPTKTDITPVEPQPVAAPSSPLASDPGPLPFTPTVAHRSARRARLHAAVLAAAAVVLFLGAAFGGFALARYIGGKPLMPPEHALPPAAPPAAPLGALVETVGEATTLAGEQGGGYAVPVPNDWTQFSEQRFNKSLPGSLQVHYVSPDGTQQLTVERFPGFYPKHSISTYRAALAATAPRYAELARSTVENAVVHGPEPGQELAYTTTDVDPDASRNGVGGLNRVTFAHVLPAGTDLWVVAVTVPIEQEDSGRSKLFDKIIVGFRVAG